MVFLAKVFYFCSFYFVLSLNVIMYLFDYKYKKREKTTIYSSDKTDIRSYV